MKTAIENGRAAVAYVEIDAGHAGQRLDNFLLSQLKGVPKSHVYRIVRKGVERVNKGRAKPETRLKQGDTVRIPPVRTAQKDTGTGLTPQMRALNAHVLYEDDALLVLNKPHGIAVHGGSGLSGGVIEALRELRPELAYLELAHRLDKDTSGCLVLAKTRHALLDFQRQLKQSNIEKHYLALVNGVWRGGQKRVDFALERAEGESSRESLSIFKPVQIFTRNHVSLLDIHLVTGRMHQARKHAALCGHPVLGDTKYGDKQTDAAAKTIGLKRLFLHARSLAFTHPEPPPDTQQSVKLEAPLPDDLNDVLNTLRQ